MALTVALLTLMIAVGTFSVWLPTSLVVVVVVVVVVW